MIGFKKFFNLVKRTVWPNRNQAGHGLTSIESVNYKKVPKAAKPDAKTCPVPPLKCSTLPLEGYLVSDRGNRMKIISASTQEQLREHLRFIATRPVSIDFYAEKSGNQLETFEILKQASISGLFVLNAVSDVEDNRSGIIGVEVRAVSNPPVHVPVPDDSPVYSPPASSQPEGTIAEDLTMDTSVLRRESLSEGPVTVSLDSITEAVPTPEPSVLVQIETEQSLADEITAVVEQDAVLPKITVFNYEEEASRSSSLPRRMPIGESEAWPSFSRTSEVFPGFEPVPMDELETLQSAQEKATLPAEEGTEAQEILGVDSTNVKPCSISVDKFRKLLRAEKPLHEISPQQWQTWTQHLRNSDYITEKISEIAEAIGCEWPYIRRNETLGDYLKLDLDGIVHLSGFGNKKIKTLVLCVAKTFLDYSLEHSTQETRVEGAIQEQVLPPSPLVAVGFDELMKVKWPLQAITADQWHTWTQKLLGSSFSSTSIADLAQEIDCDWPFSRNEELLGKYLSLTLKEVLKLQGFGRKKIRTLILCVAKAFDELQHGTDPQLLPEKDGPAAGQLAVGQAGGNEVLDLSEIVHQSLHSLKDRQREVLTKRYGLLGYHPMTLEEIAAELNVTRERVRQIEKAGIMRVKYNRAFSAAREALEEKKDAVWSILSKSRAYLPRSSSQKDLKQALPGEIRFVIDCFYGSITEWLEVNACKSTNLWYSSNYADSELCDLVSKVDNHIDSMYLPMPLQTLSEQIGCDKDLLELAVQWDGNKIIYEDYVCDVIDLYTMRSIHLHRMLIEQYPNTIVTISKLIAEYNRMNTNKCSRTDLEMTLSAAPHLFVRVGDVGWCAIGGYNTSVGRRDEGYGASGGDGGHAEETTESSPLEETNIVSIIRDYLKRNGPARFSDLGAYLRDLAGQGPAVNGAAQILTHPGNELFLLAGGLYGLWEETGCRLSTRTVLKQLLTPKVCKRYVLSRYAGEKADVNAKWLYAMEREWCIWAEREDQPELFASLLYVSEPGSWPASAQDRAEWLAKKENMGSYRFESSPGDVGGELTPALTDVLVLLKYLNDHQEINWIRTNALLGRLFGDKGSCGELAVLIGLKALAPAENWQKLHCAGPAMATVNHLLSTELHHKGELSWTKRVGKELLEEMRATVQNGYNLGWVTRSNLESMFQIVSRVDIRDKVSYPSVSDNHKTEDLTALLNEHKHAKQIQKHKSMISKLAGYIN